MQPQLATQDISEAAPSGFSGITPPERVGVTQGLSDTLPVFAVNLGFFAGPLDLLLHLVRRSEVPIAEVEMAVIADQYLQIIEQNRELDIEVATEFIVVAATLLAIKSESLLPAFRGFEGGEGYEDSAQFYEELRERLKRYEQVKLSAESLNHRAQFGVDTFSRFDRQLLRAPEELQTVEEDLQTLPTLFAGLLKRIGQKANSMRIRLEPISVVESMMKVVDLLQGAVSRVAEVPKTFRQLLTGLRGGVPQEQMMPKSTVIGGFIALLELVKRGVVGVEQSDEAGEIAVSMRLQTVDESTLVAEHERKEIETGYADDSIELPDQPELYVVQGGKRG